MSGSELLTTLLRLNYPKHNQLDGQSFDWMFENEAIAPFLEWFCHEVQPANLIDPRDMQEYQRLEESEEGCLEGRQLEEALQSLISEHEHITEDKLRAELEELQEELDTATARKDCLIQQRNKLDMHQISLADRVSRMDGVENAAKHEYKMVLQQSHTDNNMVNSSLCGLCHAVSDLAALYQSSSNPGDRAVHDAQAVFLSQYPLEEYHKAEEKFTQQLTSFTKKQFFEGIADMAGQNEGSRYEFLEISNPDSLLVRGESESVNLDDCRELARLQAFYPKSESSRITALVEERSMAAAVEFAERRCTTIKLTPYPRSIHELRPKLLDAEKVSAVIRRDLSLLSQQEIPRLLKDSATCQLTKILKGDYNLKILRQDYFTANQDQVIKQLVVQRARNEFLTMAYEVEARGHKDTHRLLTALNMLLQNTHTAQQQRMAMMSDPSLSASKHQRSTIDSRDKFLAATHSILDSTGASSHSIGGSMFLTYSQLADDADKLHHQATALRASLSSATSANDDKMWALEKQLHDCQSAVYAGSSTESGQPVLSPPSILDALTQLDTMLKRLEAAVVDIMKDVDHKKKSLKRDPLLSTERELFQYFYNDPARLRRTLYDLHSRLQAQMAK